MAQKGKVRPRGNIKINDPETFKNTIQELPSGVEKAYEDTLNKRIQSHQALFKIIMQRFNDNTKPNNPWVKEHEKTVYWQRPPEGVDNFHHPKWAWSIKTAKGFIS